MPEAEPVGEVKPVKKKKRGYWAGFRAGVASITAAGAVATVGFVSIPKNEMPADVPTRPAISIALPIGDAPYVKVNELFSCGMIRVGQNLTIYLVPSWSDSVAKCVIPGGERGVFFSAKFDTVWSE